MLTPIVRVGDEVRASFRVVHKTAALASLELDLRDDGAAGCIVAGTGLDAVETLRCKATALGTWNLWLKTVTAEGCRDETGASRPVRVLRIETPLRCLALWNGGTPPQGMDPETVTACQEALRP